MKKIGIAFLLIILIRTNENQVYAQSCPKWGPYVKTPSFKGSGVLMMADVMMPADGLAPYTYACSVQFGIGKSGGYCGIQKAGPDQPERIPNNIFSIWDFPNKVQILTSYKDPLTFVGGFGGEGTGLHSHADFGWQPGQWYTNVVRSWVSNDSTTNVGYWIFDQTAGTWKHYVSFVVPEPNARLHGNIGSFLENFADQQKRPRTAAYRSYWMLQTGGVWIHPDSLYAAAGEGSWKAQAYGKDGVLLTSCGTDQNVPSHYQFPVVMDDRPAIVKKPVVYDLAAYYDVKNRKVNVDWSLQATASPQLSYQVALYDNPKCTGRPLAVAGGIDPDVNMITIPVGGIELKRQNYYVSLQIRDIFEQDADIKIFELHDLKP